MAEKKKSRSERMYAESPELARDDEGKVAIKKPTKADDVQSGTDGVPVHIADMKEMHGRQAQEMADMHKRHQKEAKQLHKKHGTDKTTDTDMDGE